MRILGMYQLASGEPPSSFRTTNLIIPPSSLSKKQLCVPNSSKENRFLKKLPVSTSIMRAITARSFLTRILPPLQVVSACLMAWKALSVWADTPFPVMVVITESMAPAFRSGDVLLIANHGGPVQAGDLPVVWLGQRPFPMVHRVLQVVLDDRDST